MTTSVNNVDLGAEFGAAVTACDVVFNLDHIRQHIPAH